MKVVTKSTVGRLINNWYRSEFKTNRPVLNIESKHFYRTGYCFISQVAGKYYYHYKANDTKARYLTIVNLVEYSLKYGYTVSCGLPEAYYSNGDMWEKFELTFT